MTSTELVPLTKSELSAWMRGDDIETVDDAGEVDYEQALAILSAETPEAVLANLEVTPERELIGQTFTIVSVTWRKGNKSENGNNRFAFVRCADENGETFATSMGGAKVVLQLRKYEIEGWLPAQFTYESVQTNNGREMRQLVAPENPF